MNALYSYKKIKFIRWFSRHHSNCQLPQQELYVTCHLKQHKPTPQFKGLIINIISQKRNKYLSSIFPTNFKCLFVMIFLLNNGIQNQKFLTTTEDSWKRQSLAGFNKDIFFNSVLHDKMWLFHWEFICTSVVLKNWTTFKLINGKTFKLKLKRGNRIIVEIMFWSEVYVAFQMC